MQEQISNQDRQVLTVLAFLLYRMGFDERAKRVYAAIAELSETGSSDFRFAQAGLAAVNIELGDGSKALSCVKEAMKGAPLSSREAPLYLLKAQALWIQGRRQEAEAARDEYIYLVDKTRKE